MDKETGISIMKITSKLDAGPVMLQENLMMKKQQSIKILSCQI